MIVERISLEELVLNLDVEKDCFEKSGLYRIEIGSRGEVEDIELVDEVVEEEEYEEFYIEYYYVEVWELKKGLI